MGIRQGGGRRATVGQRHWQLAADKADGRVAVRLGVLEILVHYS
jgi:hypothetical protein